MWWIAVSKPSQFIQFVYMYIMIDVCNMKDRQQEIRAVWWRCTILRTSICLLRSNTCIYTSYYLTLLLFYWYETYKITWSETERPHSECENLIFFIYFVNKDISLNISLICLKFSIHVDEKQLEGSVSQIFHLGPSFYFIKSRKLSLKKWQKVFRFLS